MEIIQKDDQKAKDELAAYESSKRSTEKKLESLDEFRKSEAGEIVKVIFEEEMNDIEEKVRKIIEQDMKAVFLMKEKEKIEHIELMSKKELVLSEILGALITIKGRIFPA